MSAFWERWLAGWCLAVAGFGAILVGAAYEATSAPTILVYRLLGGGELALHGPLRFSIALIGAVTLGWSLSLWAAIRGALMLGVRGRMIWRMLTVNVTCWYVIDSALSVVTGFPANVLPNTLFAAAFLLPVWRSGVLRAAGGTRTA